MGLVNVCITSLQTSHKRVVHNFIDVECSVERVPHVVEFADVEGMIGSAFRGLIHPVNDVSAV